MGKEERQASYPDLGTVAINLVYCAKRVTPPKPLYRGGDSALELILFPNYGKLRVLK